MFAGKHGFITPRDLFKWAGRGAVGYEQLAENGYLLLGERLRTTEDRALVRQVLERQMRVQVHFNSCTACTARTACTVTCGCGFASGQASVRWWGGKGEYRIAPCPALQHFDSPQLVVQAIVVRS